MENGAGKAKEGTKAAKPFRPATRSTRKINEYFARLPANGLIRVQNGHGSHSEDSCDSFEDPPSTENDPPACLEVTQSKQQKMTNGPILLPEAQAANANLFLQEPVLKLQFDKSEAVTNGSPIKSSFLTTEITGKFQTLPPTEYINKVLNVNGSHDDDVVSKDQQAFLLNSDSNSSDSGVVIGDDYLKSPLQVPTRRRKPTTPHRMILCSSPVKGSSAAPRNEMELIKASRSKIRARVKCVSSSLVATFFSYSNFFFRLTLPSDNNVIHQDHDYDGDKVEPTVYKPIKPFKAPTVSVADNNKKVTEFFTVRRSVRKTKKEVQEERMRNIERAIREGREEGLEVCLVI